MTAGPRLTVLIPTRDRCLTLVDTIRSCLVQDYPNLRIVVSDNCSADDTPQVVAGFSDPRLQYVRTPRRLSMTGNFEFSLTLVEEGSYVMHIGDDDGFVLNGVGEAAKIIAATGALAVNSAHTVYHWPTSLYPGYANRLVIPRGRGYRWINGVDAVRDVISFRRNYSYLPSTYTGFVAKRVIDRVAAGQPYYASITPDSYSGFVNAGVLDRFVFARRPFAIAGLSGRSNGGSQITGRDASEANHYLAENDLPTHPQITYCTKSIPIVVAEAFLQARDRVARLQDIQLDMKHLCRVALRDADPQNYPAVRDAVIAITAQHGLLISVPDRPTLGQKISRELERTRMRVHRLHEGFRKFDTTAYGVIDISGAGRLAYDLLGPPQSGGHR